MCNPFTTRVMVGRKSGTPVCGFRGGILHVMMPWQSFLKILLPFLLPSTPQAETVLLEKKPREDRALLIVPSSTQAIASCFRAGPETQI